MNVYFIQMTLKDTNEVKKDKWLICDGGGDISM